MAPRFLADVKRCMVVSLRELEVTAGMGRESEFSFEQAVLEAHTRPSSVQVQDTAGVWT